MSTQVRHRRPSDRNDATERIPCVGCGALVADTEGPTFAYPDAASPGCWAIYGEVLADTYGRPHLTDALQLMVDAYAVQHPGRPTPQTIQSVSVHLISLCAVLQIGYPASGATRVRRRAVEALKAEFTWLDPPTCRGVVTVVDVAAGRSAAEREKLAHEWAASAWTAWSDHHQTIREWLGQLEC